MEIANSPHVAVTGFKLLRRIGILETQYDNNNTYSHAFHITRKL